MRLEVNLLNILLIVGISFLSSYLLMFLAKKIAVHVGAIDYPNEERRIHKKPTPRMGVIGIFFSFLLCYMIFGVPNKQLNAILIGSFILVLVGLIDDIKPVPNKLKLLFQFASALIAVYYGGFIVRDMTVFGFYYNFGTFAPYISLIFIMICVNAINFIDGMDGLSSGICSIYFLTVGIISTTLIQYSGIDVLLCFILLGSTLGYLKHNFYPAKIFMGDGGSMFLGYMIAIIALIGYKNVTLASLIIPVTLLAIPIFDTALAIIRRILKKESPFKADREHLHYQLLNIYKSVPKTVLIIYAADILFAAVTIFYALGNDKLAILIYLFLMLILFIVIVKTNILVDHKKRKSRKKTK